MYLALGAVFGVVTDRPEYMCPGPKDGEHWVGAVLPEGAKIEPPSRNCFPAWNPGERAKWVAVTTPAWLPLVARNVVRGDGVPLGRTDFSR